MADEKKNPLIGAFRAPVAGTPPGAPAAPTKPSEEKKPDAPGKAAADSKVPAAAPTTPAKPGEEKKPTDPGKSPADGKAPTAAPAAPAKPGEEKKPADPGKAAADGKAPAGAPAAPAKPGEEKKPTDPGKTAADGKAPAGAPAAPAKPGEEKKPTDPGKTAADGKAPAVAPAAPTKPSEEKKPDAPGKTTTDGKAPAVAPAAPTKPSEEKKPDAPGKTTTDGKAPTVTPAAPAKPGEEKKPDAPGKTAIDGKAPAGAPAAPAKPGEEKKPADPGKTATDGKAPATAPTAPVKPGEEKKSADPGKTPADSKPSPDKEDPGQDVEIPKNFSLPIGANSGQETVVSMKLTQIESFENHPFNVKDDKDMWDLVDSIKKFGILEPAVVIPRQAGGYEMVSGHRRMRACQLAGLTEMPVIVRKLDRDEAIISMVDANLKRENISPMEKARAYEMKLSAMKRKAGRRSKADILSGEKPMRADEQLAQQTGESRSNIQKLVRLNNLTPELQQMVEEKKLPVHTASDLSYLKKEEQNVVADAIKREDKVPSGTQAAELKKASQTGTLTTEKIESTVAPTKRELNPPLKVTFSEEELRDYFPEKGTTVAQVKRTVFEALDLRKKALARQAAKEEKAAKKPGLAR